jgi:hypothetical protein
LSIIYKLANYTLKRFFTRAKIIERA